MKIAVLCLSMSLLTGCAAMPDPRIETTVPAITGRVTHDQQPVAGARVSFHHVLDKSGCAMSKDQAVTGADGRFAIPTRKRFKFWRIFGDPLIRWGICVATADQTYVGWRGMGIGIPPDSVGFSCELTAIEAETGNGRGICSVSDE